MKTMPINIKRRIGQSLVEFALILPVLLFIVLGSFDLGWAVYTNTVISNAAREGVRVGILPDKTDADVRVRARNTAIGVPLQNSDIAIARNTAARTVKVTVTFARTPLTPMIGRFFGPSGNLTLTGVATMRTE